MEKLSGIVVIDIRFGFNDQQWFDHLITFLTHNNNNQTIEVLYFWKKSWGGGNYTTRK